MFKDKNLDTFVNLGTYKLKYVVFRITLITIASIILSELSSRIANENPITNIPKIAIYALIAVAFNSISEVTLFFMLLLNKYERLRWNIFIRSSALLSITLVLIATWIKISKTLLGDENILQHTTTQIILVVGLLILVINLLVIIISNLTKEWINNKKEINDLKQAKLLNDYNSLKDRLNPHFLFNNLSVLKSLIRYSPEDAEIFTQNFTNVYRYVLKSHEEMLVSLKEELKFLDSYIALHKERIGSGLRIAIHINEQLTDKTLPPMCLQLLVENAIKHNIANKQRPLHITIFTEENHVVIKNNINKKETAYSTKQGLTTLQKQFRFIANKEIEITITENEYTVKVPLL